MYSIYFYGKDKQWFSTVRFLGWYQSERTIVRHIRKEIQAHQNRFGNHITYSVFYNNRPVTDWYEELKIQL